MTEQEQQQRILKSCKGIPVNNLVNYIKKGVVSFSQLIDAGLPEDKAKGIRDAMAAEDEATWTNACNANTVEAYQGYLELYGEGNHALDAADKLLALDDEEWSYAERNISEKALKDYMAKFPSGFHISECRNLLSDLPWLRAKERNTLAAYQEYSMRFPGQHTAEINQLITNINDDKDWDNACAVGDSNAYKLYLNQHPNGKYSNDAYSRIQMSAGRDNFLEDLRMDPNSHDAYDIQQSVENNIASWYDISQIFGDEKTAAIKDFITPSPLPSGIPPQALQGDSTEVYFWGTPSSGKTCALGSIISSVQAGGIFEPLQCSGYDYMTRLSNIFTNRICTFPDSTAVDNIQEMRLKLRDAKGKNHTLTLIDLAGELFRSAYFKQQNMFLAQQNADTLDTAISYLKNETNKKIHFFVVEYGAHNQEWEGLRMVNYLDNMIGFLKNEKIFRKSTVGVYVLVTKCDMIPCSTADRPQKAFEYVTQQLPSFWNTLKATCEKAGVGDLKVLSFSVGDVFAKNLCIFNRKDTDKVVDKLLVKTRAEGGMWDWLRK